MTETLQSMGQQTLAVEELYRTSFGGKPLCNYLLFGRYNIAPSVEMSLLFNKVRASDAPASGNAPPGSKVSLRLKQLLMLLVCAWAVCRALVVRPKVLLYAIDKISSRDKDHDNRVDAMFVFVKENKIPFLEVLHTTARDEFLPNLRARGRSAVYLEAVDLLFAFLRALRVVRRLSVPMLDAPHHVDAVAARALAREHFYRLERAAFRVRFFRFLAKRSGVKALFSLDDIRNLELALACKELHVPTIFFQHGHFTKYHIGFLARPWLQGEYIYPDRHYVWSEYWKEELMRVGSYIPPSHIYVGGTKEAPVLPGEQPPAGAPYVLLVPYETTSPKEEVSRYIEAVLANPQWSVLFKTRRDKSAEVQRSQYNLPAHPRLFTVDDLSHWSGTISVVGGTYSTFLYDMVGRCLPVVVFKTSSDYGEGLVANGLATEVSLGEGLFAGLEQAAGLSPQELRARMQKLVGVQPALLRDTLQALGRELGLTRTIAGNTI